MDKIKAAEQGRIVNVSSLAHEGPFVNSKMDFNDLQWEKKKYVPWEVYG